MLQKVETLLQTNSNTYLCTQMLNTLKMTLDANPRGFNLLALCFFSSLNFLSITNIISFLFADYTFEDVSSPTTNSLMSTAPVMPVDSPPVYHHDHDHQRFFKCDAPKVNDVAQASSSPPHHQYYYDPAPLSPPPSYHSEADSGELVFAPFAPQLVYVGQSDCKKSRLSPIRGKCSQRHTLVPLPSQPKKYKLGLTLVLYKKLCSIS